jgi:hypothetical protein
MNLREVSTAELVTELVRREGVEEIVMPPSEDVEMGFLDSESGIDDMRHFQGPARILIVTD